MDTRKVTPPSRRLSCTLRRGRDAPARAGKACPELGEACRRYIRCRQTSIELDADSEKSVAGSNYVARIPSFDFAHDPAGETETRLSLRLIEVDSATNLSRSSEAKTLKFPSFPLPAIFSFECLLAIARELGCPRK